MQRFGRIQKELRFRENLIESLAQFPYVATDTLEVWSQSPRVNSDTHRRPVSLVVAGSFRPHPARNVRVKQRKDRRRKNVYSLVLGWSG